MVRGTLGFIVALTGCFLFMLLIIPSRIVVEIMNGVFLGIVGAMVIVYTAPLWTLIKSRGFSRVAQMVVGILLLWLSVALSRGLSVAVNVAGDDVRPRLMPAIAAVAFLGIVAGILQLAATGTVDEKWRYNRDLLGAGVVAGIVIAGVTIWVQRAALGG